MALPWAEATPASKVDTLATTSIDGVSRNLTQVINDGGEKLLQYLAERGRIFVVPDSDRYSHPLLYADGGSTTVAYRRDNFGAGGSLGASSAEILTQAKFDVVFRSRNLNFPQDMPLQGNPVSYMDALVMSNAIGMFYELESNFVLGNDSADGDAPTRRAPYEGDTDDYNVNGMSLLGLLSTGSGLVAADTTAGITATTNTQTFGGIAVNDVAKWAPQLFDAGAAATGANLIIDTDNALRDLWFGPQENADLILTGQAVFSKLADLVRETATHNAGMLANLGKEGTIQMGAATIDWHRMLNTKDEYWDFSGSGAGVKAAEYPYIFLNTKSLRLNIVAAGTISDGGPAAKKNPQIGFLKQLPGVFPHPQTTNLFKRVSMGHGFSLENGRRSFGHMEGITL